MPHIFRLSPFALLLPHVRSVTLRLPLPVLCHCCCCFAYDFLYTNKNNTVREVNHNNATLEEEGERAGERERERATHFLAGFLFIQINYDFYVCAKHVVSN